jgi:hypothetical protein
VLSERFEVRVREEHKAHLVDPWVLLQLFVRRAEGDLGGQLDGIAVDARRDRRKGDGSAAELVGDLDRPPMARGEELRLLIAARQTGPTV